MIINSDSNKPYTNPSDKKYYTFTYCMSKSQSSPHIHMENFGVMC